MQRVIGPELKEIVQYFKAAAGVAKQASCERARCGSVIVKDDVIIGQGFNGPALGKESNRMCNKPLDHSRRPKYDKTCCVHAEWRAVIDALKRNGDNLDASRIYFMRIDEAGRFSDAGIPYCTACSRFTMEAGITQFALWNSDGADIYDIAEYDRKSYDYFSPVQ